MRKNCKKQEEESGTYGMRCRMKTGSTGNIAVVSD